MVECGLFDKVHVKLNHFGKIENYTRRSEKNCVY